MGFFEMVSSGGASISKADLLLSYNSGGTKTYTFTKNYPVVFAFVSGNSSIDITYSGNGTIIGTNNTGAIAPRDYSRVIQNVKSGDTISQPNAGASGVFVIYGCE